MNRRDWIACALAAYAQPANSAEDRRRIILRQSELLASCPGQQLPAADAPLLAEAEQAAKGTVLFNRRTPVHVGLRDIDWSGGHIRHQEWPAQLNRFFHLRPLASGYKATRDERFAHAARAYIEDWLRADPYPGAAKRRAGDSALTMALRLGDSEHPGWTGTLPAFLPSPAFDDAFLERLLDSVANQAEFAAAHLTPGPNWYIAQLDALVFVSLRLPFLSKAQTFRAVGVSRLREEFARQFTADGVHIERTPTYHRWMTSVCVTYLDLARRFPDIDTGLKASRIIRSLDYAAQSEFSGFNDSPATPGGASERLRSERRAQLSRIGMSAEAPASPPLDQAFPDAGHVFSRTAWDRNAGYLAFDAGKWGGNHSHLSRLAFTYRVRGSLVVADPGTLSYEMTDALGPHGKSTAAHPTVCLDGANQSPTDAQLLATEFREYDTMVHARWQGTYWHGTWGWKFDKAPGAEIPAEHDRALLWIKEQYLLVFDRITAAPGHLVHNNLQLGPDAGELDAPQFRWTMPGLGLAVQLVSPPAGTVVDCIAGQSTPPRGWIGFRDRPPQPAPHLSFRYPVPASRTVATVLLIGPAQLRAQSPEPGLLLIEKPDGSADQIAWPSQGPPRRIR